MPLDMFLHPKKLFHYIGAYVNYHQALSVIMHGTPVRFSVGNGPCMCFYPFFTLRQIIIRSFLPYGHSLMMHALNTHPQQYNLPSGPMCQSSPMFIPCVRTGTILPYDAERGLLPFPLHSLFPGRGYLICGRVMRVRPRYIYNTRTRSIYIPCAEYIYNTHAVYDINRRGCRNPSYRSPTLSAFGSRYPFGSVIPFLLPSVQSDICWFVYPPVFSFNGLRIAPQALTASRYGTRTHPPMCRLYIGKLPEACQVPLIAHFICFSCSICLFISIYSFLNFFYNFFRCVL